LHWRDRRMKRFAYPRMDYPALEARHISECRIFANRNDLIASLESAKGGVIAEVGVAAGDFSAIMMKCLRPTKFVAIDIFKMHQVPVVGTTREALFEGMSQLEFYTRRFADRGNQVVIEEGLSHERLAGYPDRFFDLIYIDAAHDYESVKRDALVAKDKVKADGYLIFNDYIMLDHYHGVPYGVVQAVNELVFEEDWHLVGFALQQEMFCDVAIQKAPDSVQWDGEHKLSQLEIER